MLGKVCPRQAVRGNADFFGSLDDPKKRVNLLGSCRVDDLLRIFTHTPAALSYTGSDNSPFWLPSTLFGFIITSLTSRPSPVTRVTKCGGLRRMTLSSRPSPVTRVGLPPQCELGLTSLAQLSLSHTHAHTIASLSRTCG